MAVEAPTLPIPTLEQIGQLQMQLRTKQQDVQTTDAMMTFFNTESDLLSGYIRLRPREGWDLAQGMLQDTQRSFTERYAIIGTLRFYHGWKPEETRDEVLRCLGLLISQGEMADIAVEDLRRWETWTLTDDILSQFGKKTHAAPIVRRAIVRYALCCPQPQAQRFVALLRKQDPKLVGDVEESLQFEKQK